MSISRASVLAGSSLLLAAGTVARADVIEPATVSAVSSTIGSPYDRVSGHTVDGSGLNVNGPGTHSASPDGTMWLNAGTGAFDNGTPDKNPFITWDLGSIYQLDTVRVWNYNEVNLTTRGVATGDISISYDNATYTDLGVKTFTQAPGTATVDFSQYFSIGQYARYVRFSSLTDFPGADNGFVGLSEVQFNAVPEPASISLIAIAGTTLLARRRRDS